MGYRSHIEKALAHFSNNEKMRSAPRQVCCSGRHNQQKSSRLSQLARALMFTVKPSTFCTLKHRRCTSKVPTRLPHLKKGVHFLPSISMSSGSLSCCSPAFCCCCCCCCVWWWWWFMLAAVVVVMRSSRLSLSPSTLSTVASAGNRLLDCWWGVVGYGGGVDRSSLGGRACSAATSALSAVSAGDWGGEVGGGAGRETRTYLLAIRPISTPLVVASDWQTAGWDATGGSPLRGPPADFS